jgi:hypothetical protein
MGNDQTTITPAVRASIAEAQAICDAVIALLESAHGGPSAVIGYTAGLGDVRDLLGLLADGTAADIITE